MVCYFAIRMDAGGGGKPFYRLLNRRDPLGLGIFRYRGSRALR